MMQLDVHQIRILTERLAFLKPRQENIVHCYAVDWNSPRWVFRSHSHDFVEMVYYLNGGAHIVSTHGDWDVHVFEVIIRPEGVDHCGELGSHNYPQVITLGLRFPGGSGIPFQFAVKDPEGQLKWLFIELHRLYQGTSLHKVAMTQRIIELIFFYFSESCNNGKFGYQDRIDIALHFIRENFSRYIKVSELADVAGISTSHFTKVFRERTGKTPVEFVNWTRIEIAKKLLEDPMFTIANIADRIGFADTKYFCRTFKKLTGSAPSKLRSSLLRASNRRTFWGCKNQ